MTERRPGTGIDPMELWRRWFETGSKVWAEVLQGAGESYADPYGLYRQWFEGMQGIHQQAIGATDGEGETQTEDKATPHPSGATGYHTVEVTVA